MGINSEGFLRDFQLEFGKRVVDSRKSQLRSSVTLNRIIPYSLALDLKQRIDSIRQICHKNADYWNKKLAPNPLNQSFLRQYLKSKFSIELARPLYRMSDTDQLD